MDELKKCPFCGIEPNKVGEHHPECYFRRHTDVEGECDVKWNIRPIEDALRVDRDRYIAINVELQDSCESKQRMVEYLSEERDALQSKLDEMAETITNLDISNLQLQAKLEIAVEALEFAHKDMMNMKNHKEIDWTFHYHTLDNSIILPALKKLEEK